MAARKWLTERLGPGPIINSSGVQIHEQSTSMALSAHFWQMIGKGPTMISVDVQVHKQLPSSGLLHILKKDAFEATWLHCKTFRVSDLKLKIRFYSTAFSVSSNVP